MSKIITFSANVRKSASIYVVEYFSKGEVIFKYETSDYSLAQRIQERSMWLYMTWLQVRAEQTARSGWPTYAILADTCDFPTRTGGHAIIFAEIENAYL